MGCVMCTPLDDLCNISLRRRKRPPVELGEFPQAAYEGHLRYSELTHLTLSTDPLLGPSWYGTRD